MGYLNKYIVNNNIDRYFIQVQDLAVGGSSKKLFYANRFTDERYMIKLPKRDYITESSYNDHIAEFLGSNIIQLLGYNSQDAFLIRSNSIPEGVMVKLFNKTINELSSKVNYFYSMEYKVLDMDKIAKEYHLRSSEKRINEKLFNRFLIQMLIVDYVIVNIDRHPGNIGFIENSQGIFEPSPFYDSGTSLLTRYFNHDYTKIIQDHKLVNYKIIRDGNRIQFKDVLELLSLKTKNNNLYRDEINYVLNNYNKNKYKIHQLIDVIVQLNSNYIDTAKNIKDLLEFTTSELKTLLEDNHKDNDLFSWE